MHHQHFGKEFFSAFNRTQSEYLPRTRSQKPQKRSLRGPAAKSDHPAMVEVQDEVSLCWYRARVVIWTLEWALVEVFVDAGGNCSAEEYVNRKFIRPAPEDVSSDDLVVSFFKDEMEIEVQLIDGDGIECWSPAVVIQIWEEDYAHVRMRALSSRLDRIVELQSVRQTRSSDVSGETVMKEESEVETEGESGNLEADSVDEEEEKYSSSYFDPHRSQHQPETRARRGGSYVRRGRTASSIVNRIHGHDDGVLATPPAPFNALIPLVQKIFAVPPSLADMDYLLESVREMAWVDRADFVDTGDVRELIVFAPADQMAAIANYIDLSCSRSDRMQHLFAEKERLEDIFQTRQEAIVRTFEFASNIAGAVVGSGGANVKRAREVEGVMSVSIVGNCVTVTAKSEEIAEKGLDELRVEIGFHSIPDKIFKSILLTNQGKMIQNVQRESGLLRLKILEDDQNRDETNFEMFGSRASMQRAIRSLSIIFNFNRSKREVEKEMESLYGNLGLAVPADLKSVGAGLESAVCFLCQKKGHIQKNCPERAAQRERGEQGDIGDMPGIRDFSERPARTETNFSGRRNQRGNLGLRSRVPNSFQFEQSHIPDFQSYPNLPTRQRDSPTDTSSSEEGGAQGLPYFRRKRGETDASGSDDEQHSFGSNTPPLSQE